MVQFTRVNVAALLQYVNGSAELQINSLVHVNYF